MHLIGYMWSPVGDYTSCKLALICPSIAELCSYAFNKVYQMHVRIWLGWGLVNFGAYKVFLRTVCIQFTKSLVIQCSFSVQRYADFKLTCFVAVEHYWH